MGGLLGANEPYTCNYEPENVDRQRPSARTELTFAPRNTFVGCVMLDAKETLNIRVQADTFDASTSLRCVCGFDPDPVLPPILVHM